MTNISQVKASIRVIGRKLEKDLLPETHQNLTSLKSIDTVIVSVLLGDTLNPDRFDTHDKFARYNGSAPKERSSGGKVRHRARKGCNHRLKKTLRQISRVTCLLRLIPVLSARFPGAQIAGKRLETFARPLSGLMELLNPLI